MADWNIPASKKSLDEILKDGGYYDISGIWNSLIQKDGKLYRYRVETFVFKGDSVYFRKIPNSKTHAYEIPGGATDKFLSNPQQAKMEVEEEARIVCKNIKYSGVSYIRERKRPLHEEEGHIYWDGTYNEVYVADYHGQYYGEVDPRNQDDRFIKYGKFYPIEELLPILQEEHKAIFEQYLPDDPIQENTQTPEFSPSNDLKSEDKTIPGEWVAQVRYYYDRYQNTKDLNDRQKLLNLGWDPNQIPTDDMINYKINTNSSKERSGDPNCQPEDHVTYESDEGEGILSNDNEKEPLPVSADWYNRVLFLYDQFKNTNGEQFKSEMLQMGWNPEIEPSIENIKRLIKYKEATEPDIIDLTEGVIIDTPNTAYNYDKWENGESNVILVTGLSGSGKTTLARAIAKEDEAILIQLDMLQCYARFKENNIPNPGLVYVEKYLKANPKAKESDFSDIRLEGFGEVFLDYFNWLLKYIAKDKKNKYVVEGIHILLFVKYSSIKKYPLVCMGTSMTKSLIRRWFRDQFSISDLVKYGYGEIKLWKDWEDQYQEFKDSIQEMVDIFPSGWFRENYSEIDFDAVDLDAARGPIKEARYDKPYNAKQVKDNYGEELYNRLIQDPAHKYRMDTGIELIHKEPSKEELERIWKNWNCMNSKQKAESDKKSMELFGKSNKDHYKELLSAYNESEELDDFDKYYLKNYIL